MPQDSVRLHASPLLVAEPGRTLVLYSRRRVLERARFISLADLLPYCGIHRLLQRRAREAAPLDLHG